MKTSENKKDILKQNNSKDISPRLDKSLDIKAKKGKFSNNMLGDPSINTSQIKEDLHISNDVPFSRRTRKVKDCKKIDISVSRVSNRLETSADE